ncbi:sporulation protein YlmC with PRC-barrel domain [Nocardioides daedukensis]|uniref:Sporulation protein YlmC with PRC-barrel domain n=1 Tax=Nocardioides daedukensis TaxID=634462 RepID=A0A7Y9S002_9ACTN|nr:hypothetical protein [Nocardioides daedukensis]NYG57234.1 sporulation protein YlmC with PRC-barrel domain [Nocardioides daedukensis]
MPNHLREGGEFDAVLNLLDRQVIDADGYMVCKVDDLELAQDDIGSLRVTGLLAGPAALLPRFSGRLGGSLLEQWRRLGTQQADRTTPWRIDMALVAKVDYAVRLSVLRDGLLRKPTDDETGTTYRRLDHLLGMRVHRDGEDLGRVLDVRIGNRGGDLECRHLIVGRGRPGTMLGYDRSRHMGPAVVSHLIRWMHRHTGQVAIDDVVGWDWSAGQLEVRSDLKELTHA